MEIERQCLPSLGQALPDLRDPSTVYLVVLNGALPALEHRAQIDTVKAFTVSHLLLFTDFRRVVAQPCRHGFNLWELRLVARYGVYPRVHVVGDVFEVVRRVAVPEEEVFDGVWRKSSCA